MHFSRLFSGFFDKQLHVRDTVHLFAVENSWSSRPRKQSVFANLVKVDKKKLRAASIEWKNVGLASLFHRARMNWPAKTIALICYIRVRSFTRTREPLIIFPCPAVVFFLCLSCLLVYTPVAGARLQQQYIRNRLYSLARFLP